METIKGMQAIEVKLQFIGLDIFLPNFKLPKKGGFIFFKERLFSSTIMILSLN